MKKANDMFNKALEIGPENSYVYDQVGQWYFKGLGNNDKAEYIFKKGLEIDPGNSAIYNSLGEMYTILQDDKKITLKRYKEAEKYFLKAGECSYEKLGILYILQGKYSEAEKLFKKAYEKTERNDRFYGFLAITYAEQKKYRLSDEYFRRANEFRLKTYNPITKYNYQRLKQIIMERGIRLICVQYPMRSVKPLKKMLEPHNGTIFVDNEKLFKEAVEAARYNEYFWDIFGGDFGHCTPKGNRLLAKNIADVILKECFDK